MMTLKRCAVGLAATAMVLAAAGCSKPAEEPPLLIGGAWVRTTDGAKDQKMTAMFGDISNPGSKTVKLMSADCGDVAGKTEVHEMAMVDGKKVMRAVEGGVEVPSGSHLHLAPGGFHVMLMMLKQELPVGSEVSCTLTFDNDQKLTVTAPVKKFTEEEESYHTHAPS